MKSGKLRVFGCVAVMSLLFGSSQMVRAQSNDLSILQRILQSTSGSNQQQLPTDNSGQYSYPSSSQIQSPVTGQTQTLPPQNNMMPVENISNIEKLFSVKSGVRLDQFGYKMLGGLSTPNAPIVGAIQDSYVLGPGDEVIITLRGQENSTYNVPIGRDGMVILPRLRPMRAAGLTLAEFRDQLQQQVSQAFQATKMYLSLGQLRQIAVTVVGNVPNPGVRNLSALATPLDALLLSGGVKKAGSLRRVQIIRDGKSISLDLYGVIEGSGPVHNMQLREGDRIVVPALGPVFAVAGMVRRPAIYEFPAGQRSMTVSRALSLAGGLEIRGKYRLEALTTLPDGRTQLVNLSEGGLVRDSDILIVEPAASQQVGDVRYSGPMAMGGQYALGHTPTLKALLSAPGALGKSPYMLFGLIVRKDPKTLIDHLLAFAPVSVLTGTSDISLQSQDTVRVFTLTEMSWLTRQAQAYEHRIQATSSLGQIEDMVAQRGNAGGSFTDTSSSGLGGSSSERTALKLAELDVLSTELRLRPENIDFGAHQSSGANGASANGAGTSSTAAPTSSMESGFASNSYSGLNNPYQTGPSLTEVTQGPSTQPTAVPATTPATMSAPPSEIAKNPYAPVQQPAANPNSLYELANNVPSTPEGISADAAVYNFDQLGRQLGVDPLILAEFFLDNGVDLRGAVRNPGAYVAASGINLGDLVAAAGGTSGWADNSGVEMVTTNVDSATGAAHTERKLLRVSDAALNTISVVPHDQFRFNEVFNDLNHGTVTIKGEVRFPGTYQVLRGDRLSSILARAGGLTDDAYPYGTVFLRASQAHIERENLELQVQTIRRENLNSPDALQQINDMVKDIQNSKTLGRITVQSDPAVLASHPQEDVLLENSDVIYVPQRPSSVTVVGEVQKPGAYLFKSNLTADDYIDLAGGMARYADSDYAFVVFPDGKTRKIDSGWINFDSGKIPPGSVIVIPRDLNPLTWHQFITDSTSFISQWILAAASLAVLSNN